MKPQLLEAVRFLPTDKKPGSIINIPVNKSTGKVKKVAARSFYKPSPEVFYLCFQKKLYGWAYLGEKITP